MKLLSVSILSYFVTSALAADCSVSASDSIPTELYHAYWDARNQMCSNSNCAHQQNCQVNTVATNSGWKVSVTLKREKHGVKGFKNCYDATDNIINQCVYREHRLNGKWEYGGQTYTLESQLTKINNPSGCNTDKYCAYTYRNNNCAIRTWNCDQCPVVLFYECINGFNCPFGGRCINNLCCHDDRLAGGAAQCPTIDDLKACGNYVRQLGGAGQMVWVPPHTEIPNNLKCGC